MAEAYTNSRKRTDCPNVLANESLYHYSCQNDHTHQHGTRDPKRQKPEPRLRSPAQPAAPVASIDSRSPNLQGGSFEIHSRTNTDIDSYEDETSLLPSITSATAQRFLVFNGQHLPQQDLGTPNSVFGTPASYTATNDTLSPGPFSLNGATVVDAGAGGVASQSPGNVNELPFDDENDFGVEFMPEWGWNPLDGSTLPFDSSDGFDTVLVPNLTAVLNDNPNALSFSGQFVDNQPVREDNPFMLPAFTEPVTNVENSPWFSSHAFYYGDSANLNNEYINQNGISMELSQPTVSQTPKRLAPQPSKRSSITSPTFTWNNTTLGVPSVQPLIVRKSGVNLPPRLGVRKGPLSLEGAEHAQLMRKRKPCWPCKLLKVKCSLGSPCARCTKIFQSKLLSSIPSPSTHVLCYRGRLGDYTGTFFPDFVTARLSNPAVAMVIHENAEFTDNKIDIEMSSGPAYPPLCLTGTEFNPLKPEFLAYEYVAPNSATDDGPQTFSTSYAPPIGLNGVPQAHLKEVCLNHIKSIIDQERSIGEVNHGDISIISWKAFEAVNKYRRLSAGSGSGALLHEAVMIYTMHYFMSRVITISKSSAERVVGRLRRPQLLHFEQSSQVLTYTLVNLQIKQAMQKLLWNTTRTVLNGFEKQMAVLPKTKDSWVDSFCVVLILCMCIEAAQVTSDSFAMAALRRNPSSKISRQDTCRRLDDKTYRELTDLFCKAYKTKRAKGQKPKLGFNPIRHGFPVNAGEGITPQMRDLVNDMKDIISKHGDEMTKTAQHSLFDNPSHDLLTQHMIFRRKNSGRLTSTFLLSFMQ